MSKCEYCYQMFKNDDIELYVTHDRELVYVCPNCKKELEEIDSHARICSRCNRSTLNYVKTPKGKIICGYCVDELLEV